VFVLALTSNEEGPEVQSAVRDDVTVAGHILSELKALNGSQTPMGPYGAVVGATIGSTDEDLAINGPLLVPGLGAQGGTVDDVVRLFGPVADFVLPSTSRGVLAAGPDVMALRDSAAQVNAELVRSLEMNRTSRSPQ
jgi:orotidine-5'-phosphate decarboxylase